MPTPRIDQVLIRQRAREARDFLGIGVILALGALAGLWIVI